MTVVGTTTFAFQLSYLGDILDLWSDNISLLERNGFRNIRLFDAHMAGPESGTLLVIMEADSMSDFGAAWDRYWSDPDVQSFQERWLADRPTHSDPSYSVLTDVTPPHLSDSGDGYGESLEVGRANQVMGTIVYDVRPGKFIEALQLWTENIPLISRAGFRGIRLLHGSIVGPFSGVLQVFLEANNMAEFGAAWDAYWSDPDAQAFHERWDAADLVAVRPSYAVLTEVTPF